MTFLKYRASLTKFHTKTSPRSHPCEGRDPWLLLFKSALRLSTPFYFAKATKNRSGLASYCGPVRLLVRLSPFISIACILSSLSITAIFEHDRAALAYQKGDYAQSRDFMQKTLVCNPGDPVCLYDSGVVAYKNNDLDQAQAYFSTVTQQSNVDAPLLEKAHFNKAKVYEKRDEYEQAIEQYNRVLQINPDNYKAQEEKARLEKLLEKKKKEQEQQKPQKEQKQGSSQKDSKQQNNKNQKSSDQDAKQDKQNQPDTGSQAQHEEKHRGEKSNDQETRNEKTQTNDANQESRGNEQGTEEQAGQTVDKQAEHAKPSDKESENKPDGKESNKKSIAEKKSAEQAKQTDAPDGLPSRKKMDAMLERILAEQEKNDASLNKKYIKATVKQHMAGGNDQNCW